MSVSSPRKSKAETRRTGIVLPKGALAVRGEVDPGARVVPTATARLGEWGEGRVDPEALGEWVVREAKAVINRSVRKR